MLCFDDEKWKDNNIFSRARQDNNQSNILSINAIFHYYSSFVLLLKTCAINVSFAVIFHVQIE